ncbi:CapA family protein [Chryseolinea sp. H1M3-3]|uniref:CapA family protein n=1 Tax=Chryseolinea sp. H1M3-3 TaxID=3034144 RepID=UPI0023EC4A93|nr:CapA family protein [Chryseolinea sp. H1M3-3]
MRYYFFLSILFVSSIIRAQERDTLSQPSDSLSISIHVAIDTIAIVPDTVSIIGVGDIMMGTNYPEDKLPPNDGAHLLKNVESILKDADVTFGNLEGTLLDEGGVPKKCNDPKVCYAFRTPVRYVNNLVRAGFDMMSLANNHAGDMGDPGRKSSIKTLEEANILHAGQVTHPTVIFEKDSVKYGLAAFSPNSNCVDINDIEGAIEIVKRLDSICDIVIVSFHGGAEGAKFESVPRTNEIYYGENRGDVYKFAHTLIDAGADIIFGHGPHVTRAIEIYNERFIAYSLGNFCTYRGISVNGVNGLAPIVKVFTDKKGKFFYGKIIPTYQTYETGVRIDPQNQVIKKIQELTKKDFPESPIRIDENGLITYLAQ